MPTLFCWVDWAVLPLVWMAWVGVLLSDRLGGVPVDESGGVSIGRSGVGGLESGSAR